MARRRVLVTGAASGIGRATATAIAAAGGRVAAIDVDDSAGARFEEEARARGFELSYMHCDVSNDQQVARVVENVARNFNGLDVLMHCAGVMAGQLEDIRTQDESTWDRVIDINLKGAYLMAKHAARIMVPAGSGVMILVGSKAGVAVGSGSYPYGASKGGVHGLALTLDRHLGPKGIRVNDVCPGEVDTPLIRASLQEAADRGGDPVGIDRTLSNLTSPEQVASVLAFLASDAASCVRGTVFTS